MNNYTILDYDGYICKSYFAGDGEYDKSYEILSKLVDAAVTKSNDYFKEDTSLIKVVSGHCWKKELYSTYKQTREKDPYVGAYRDFILELEPDILKPSTLEADELIVMCHDYLVNQGKSSIIFSDDKDILYTTLVNCRINITEQININYDERHLYAQMLAGDKEDDVRGIFKVGMKTAHKLLEYNGFDIYGVIKTYREKNISKEECLKNINLIIPMKREFNTKIRNYDLAALEATYNNKILDHAIKTAQEGQLEYLQQKVEEVYA